jgi:cyclic pyranopterin monophosphate synthase
MRKHFTFNLQDSTVKFISLNLYLYRTGGKGFEPLTPWSVATCSSPLSYTPLRGINPYKKTILADHHRIMQENTPSNFSQSNFVNLSHLDREGQAQMVDVSEKTPTIRQAVASATVRMRPETFTAIETGNTPKGDVLGIARLAGIMAAKQTANLIPLCHPLPIQKVEVQVISQADLPGYEIQATIKTKAETGVEMEALTAVSVAALTLYDMAKGLEKSIQIESIHLVSKTGGKSGDYNKLEV